MLLENNTNKVINLIYEFDDLSNIDKVRLAIYLLQNKHFNVNFNIEDMINTLKSILGKLNSNYTKVITNFSKYKHLLFFSAKYLELTEKEKKHFTVEMLFNIYNSDFNNNEINILINDKLLVYDYYYQLFD